MKDNQINISQSILSSPLNDAECYHFDTPSGTIIDIIFDKTSCFKLFGIVPTTIMSTNQILTNLTAVIANRDTFITFNRGLFTGNGISYKEPTSIKDRDGFSIVMNAKNSSRLILSVSYPKGRKLVDALEETGYLMPAGLHIMFLIGARLINKGITDPFILCFITSSGLLNLATDKSYVYDKEDVITDLDHLVSLIPEMIEKCLELQAPFDEEKSWSQIIIETVVDYHKIYPCLLAQLILKMGEYFNSQQFLTGPLGNRFYNYPYTNAVSSGITMIANTYFQTEHFYSGVIIDGYQIAFTNRKDSSLDCISTTQAFMQVLEWHVHGIKSDALKYFAPDHTILIAMNGSEIEHENIPNLEEIQFETIELISESEKDGIYDPYCSFTLRLPDEFISFVERINPAIQYVSPSDRTELKSIRVFTEGYGMWVRLVGKNGGGAIISWEPLAPHRPNLLSLTTAIVLDLVFAALWRDLRIEGNKSILPAASKHKGSPDQIQPLSDNEQKKKKLQHRAFPRKSDYRLTFSGNREWGTPEEISHIKRRLHTVSGHPRTLPAGHHPDPEKVKLAVLRKIKLNMNQTFVRRHLRGKSTESEPVEVIVRSKGLSELCLVIS